MSDYPKSYTHNNPRPQEEPRSAFPLCEQLGIKTVSAEWAPEKVFLMAQDLERILEKADIVYSESRGTIQTWGSRENSEKFYHDCKFGRVVCIQPITKPDTAEGLLKELVASWGSSIKIRDDIIERAKKLVGKD